MAADLRGLDDGVCDGARAGDFERPLLLKMLNGVVADMECAR